jgi:hypothetical protein
METLLRKVELEKKLNKKPEVLKMVKLMQQLRDNHGRTDEQIMDTLKGLDMPLGCFLFLSANYSDLMSLKLN